MQRSKRSLNSDETYSGLFSNLELDEALKFTKTGKAAGYDGIYAEFLKYLGTLTRSHRWNRVVSDRVDHVPTKF